MKKYVLRPGYGHSVHDGGRHYIGAPVLARLYGVDLKDCIIIDDDTPDSGRTHSLGLPILRLRTDGCYQSPKKEKHEN